MSANRRRDKPPTPDNLARLLSEDQRAALRNLESFGYRLAFIRHAGSRKQEVMILQADGKSLALLDVNGELQEDPSLRQRDDGKNRSLVKTNPKPNLLSSLCRQAALIKYRDLNQRLARDFPQNSKTPIYLIHTS